MQVVTKRRGKRSFTHVGSAHDAAELEVLGARAERITAGGQQALDLESLAGPARPAAGAPGAGTGLVVAKRSQVLWDVLGGAWRDLGLEAAVGGDQAFTQMALARLVEPTNKEQVPRVLGELGVDPVSVRTLFRSLRRCVERGYRDSIQAALREHVIRLGDLSLVLYDVTVRREVLVVRVGVRDLHLAACRGGWLVAGGSLTGETPGRVGAALTKPWYASTTGWCARGERFAEVYARNRCHHLS